MSGTNIGPMHSLHIYDGPTIGGQPFVNIDLCSNVVSILNASIWYFI